MHIKIFHVSQGISIVQKLSNKQSAKMICRFDRLRTSHSKRQKSHMSFERLLSADAFNFIVPDLTSCEDLATALLIYECIVRYKLK